ncbi:MAG TPA: 50S ribosomal protein L27 [Petrotogaceae bacterium]|jgi:large subunit ribosomal protein L27|nr:50S ribosomal protein L27 [Petrotogaceae bacterium]HQF32829.1 50S ribosomal protein L27 [Petrotogaceae bacterium]HQH32236.1 50S ribosomal protein L27 [Petrotogaceae bacterium]HQI78163.1 50S ribosomal protein L27 [Petrotogaceae bacterium]
MKLNLQFFAGSAGDANRRDSNPKYLGVKAGEGKLVTSGSIIIRQRGTKIHPGKNVGLGKDFTIFATADGRVKFEEKNNRKYVSVYPQAQ